VRTRHAVKSGLVVILALTLSARAYAFLGIGDVVFDPSVYAQAVQQLIQLEQQYAQLVQTYQTVRSQYEHLARMAQKVPVNMSARYRAVVTPWRTSSAANALGTTGDWIVGINTGNGVAAGYAQATEALGAYGAALGNVPADQRERLKTTYATVELTDGANLHGMETVGRLRDRAPDVEMAIRALEDDSLSSDPAMNTEIAVLNKMNAAQMISVRTGQDTNKLLADLAEQQVIAAKRARDAEARAINQHIRFISEGRAIITAQAAGASQAMRDWRMP
jgi:hypothetical protein